MSTEYSDHIMSQDDEFAKFSPPPPPVFPPAPFWLMNEPKGGHWEEYYSDDDPYLQAKDIGLNVAWPTTPTAIELHDEEEFDLDALARQAIVVPSVQKSSPQKSPSSEIDYIHLSRHTPHEWLDNYIAYSKKRSPRGYNTLHEMSGIFALSVTAGGRVRVSHVRWHSTALYSMAVAHSTRYAKSTTANVARAVLDKAGLWWRFGPDMMTPQLMLSFMSDKNNSNSNSNSDSDKEEDVLQKARQYHEGQMAWIYDEFSQKLKSMMKDSGPYAEFHGILRKFNEKPDSFVYATRSYGFERINNPYLTLMGLTTPDELRQFGNQGGQLWTDGFFARFLMAGPTPQDKPKKTPPTSIPPVPYELLKPLGEINQWLGFRTSYKSPLPIIGMNPNALIKNEFFQYELFLDDRCKESDLSASYQRLAVEHCPKMAALLAMADGQSNIEMNHALRAIEIGEKVRYGLDSLYKELTTYTNTEKQKRQNQQEEKITRILEKATIPMTVAAIRRKTGNSPQYRMSNEDVNSTLATLNESGITNFEMKGNKRYWSLIPDSN